MAFKFSIFNRNSIIAVMNGLDFFYNKSCYLRHYVNNARVYWWWKYDHICQNEEYISDVTTCHQHPFYLNLSSTYERLWAIHNVAMKSVVVYTSFIICALKRWPRASWPYDLRDLMTFALIKSFLWKQPFPCETNVLGRNNTFSGFWWYVAN